MSYAYTPGLKITDFLVVRKKRELPIEGDILVREGDIVECDTIVARTFIPGDPYVIPISFHLKVDPRDLEYYMLKKQGDSVREGEIIAMKKAFFGLFKSYVSSPISGKIEFISTLTGQVSIREPPKAVEVNTFIPGKVTEVIPKKGVVIETSAAFVQGILGVGGERHGKLKTIASPDEPLTTDLIDSGCSGKILVGGACDSEVLQKAIQMGAVGVIVGGIAWKELCQFLGYEVGVAITGHEDIALTLIITEGFGSIRMASRTFKLLKSLEGWEASINGATQIRAGVIRPEIIIPLKNERIARSREKLEQKDTFEGLVPGMHVRIIRDPWFGSIGRVINLPRDYFRIQTGSEVRVLEVELVDGNQVIVPRANVEIIEE